MVRGTRRRQAGSRRFLQADRPDLHVGPNEAFSSTASDWDNLFTKRSVTGV